MAPSPIRAPKPKPMSTWISKALLTATLALAACVAPRAEGTRVVRLVAGNGDSFALAAPPGFCLTGKLAKGDDGGGVAAFARCPGSTGPAALLTASVAGPGSGAGGLPDPAALSDFFRSPTGLRSLSRAGQAETVTLHQVLAVQDAVLVRLTDRSGSGAGPALAGESWRAVTVTRGRLVTLSATGAAEAALTPAAGRRLIDAFLGALRAGNPA